MSSTPNLATSTNADVLTGGEFGCIVGSNVNETVGFYGSAGVAQQSVSTVTTVAQLLVILENTGLVRSAA